MKKRIVCRDMRILSCISRESHPPLVIAAVKCKEGSYLGLLTMSTRISDSAACLPDSHTSVILGRLDQQ